MTLSEEIKEERHKLRELTKRNRTLVRRVERLRAAVQERDAELTELKWHLGWVIDYLERKNMVCIDRIEAALEYAYKAKGVNRE